VLLQLESAPYVWEDDVFRRRDGAAAERIASKRRDRIKRIAEAEQTRLDMLSRQLTAQANGWEALTDFRDTLTERHQAVLAVAPPQAVPDGDDYIVRLVVQSRTPPILTIRAGGSYSVEDGLTADAAVTGDNYWDQTANFALQGQAGTEVQRARLMGQITRSFSRYFRTVYSVEGWIFHDHRQALGDTPHLTVDERETGLQPKISLRYDSAEGLSAALAPGRTHIVAGLDVALDYRDVNLSARGLAGAGLQDGTLAALTITSSWDLAYAFAAGPQVHLTRVEFSVSGSAERGLDALGGHFAYTQYQLAIQSTLYFGRAPHPDALFVRYRQGLGVSSDDTPLFQLFRLGGAETVAGLEHGEVVAANFGFRQVELGVSLAALGLTPPGEPSADFSPAGAYVKLFYDTARVTSGHAFDQLFSASPGLEGYGLGLEFHKLDGSLAITIGYAFSPDSLRHRSGTFFTGVALFF
jgi:outer membrane protein assembly factor BamA